ncbi:MAG: TIGR02186 family protein [Candidatus Latescibacteria bacterium]|nr:TIGR02186 family protein [Candidatus Latescibacterota bacterium]
MICRFWAGVLTTFLAVPCAAEPSLQLFPSRVEVDLFFSGARLVATGTVPKDCQVVLKLEGERRAAEYRRKDRRGPLWVSTGRVVFDALPGLYMVAASSDSADLLRQLEVVGEGFGALRRGVTIQQSPPGDDGFVFEEFLRLEIQRGFYAVRPASVALSDRDGEFAGFRAEFRVPPAVRPETYRATLYCFNKHRLISETEQSVSVEKTGLVRVLSSVAFQHGGLYGIVSVLVALVAGLVVGMIFRKL